MLFLGVSIKRIANYNKAEYNTSRYPKLCVLFLYQELVKSSAPLCFQGSIMNGIADAVRGKQYDSPPYTVVATFEDGSDKVNLPNMI